MDKNEKKAFCTTWINKKRQRKSTLVEGSSFSHFCVDAFLKDFKEKIAFWIIRLYWTNVNEIVGLFPDVLNYMLISAQRAYLPTNIITDLENYFHNGLIWWGPWKERREMDGTKGRIRR